MGVGLPHPYLLDHNAPILQSRKYGRLPKPVMGHMGGICFLQRRLRFSWVSYD